MVQRKIGFEFETGVKVTDKGKDLPYDAAIYKPGKPWKIHADNSSMEFITSPLETGAEVKAVVEDVTKYVERLQTALDKSGRLGSLGDFGTGYAKLYEASFDGKIAAKPQVTFGVPFGNIPSFLNRVSAAPLKSYSTGAADDKEVKLTYDQRPQLGSKTDASAAGAAFAAKVAAKHADLKKPDLDSAAGFVTLVVRYLYDIAAKLSPSPIEYAKSALTILSRTDFASMFRAQNAKVRQEFGPESIEEAAGMPGGALARFRLYSSGLQDTPIEHRFTAEQWIQSIKDPGFKAPEIQAEAREADKKRQESDNKQPTTDALRNKDLLSRGAVGHDSNSMGAFSLSDHDDPERFLSSLPLLEFRELANQPALPWDRWLDFAMELYELYEAEVKLEAQAKAAAPPEPAAAEPASAARNRRGRRRQAPMGEVEDKSSSSSSASTSSGAGPWILILLVLAALLYGLSGGKK